MNKSESIKNIAKALCDLQGEIENPKNTAKNPFFNSAYAPLPDILNDIRKPMKKYGLSILQSPSGDGQNVTITTLIMHESGEWIETDPLTLKADKVTAQGAGSAITYARRYALSAVLGISSEDDDDGNHATGNGDKGNDVSPNGYQNKPQTPVKLSEPQIKRAIAIGLGKGYTAENVKKWAVDKYKVSSIEDLTKPQYDEFCKGMEGMEKKAS